MTNVLGVSLLHCYGAPPPLATPTTPVIKGKYLFAVAQAKNAVGNLHRGAYQRKNVVRYLSNVAVQKK